PLAAGPSAPRDEKEDRALSGRAKPLLPELLDDRTVEGGPVTRGPVGSCHATSLSRPRLCRRPAIIRADGPLLRERPGAPGEYRLHPHLPRHHLCRGADDLAVLRSELLAARPRATQ